MSLPLHLINIIMDNIPINQLIKQNAVPVKSGLVESYVDEYINKKLLTDLYKSGYLKSHKLYEDKINNKLFSISNNITRTFIDASNNISGGCIDINTCLSTPITIVKFEIVFKLVGIGKYFKCPTNDYKLTIMNYNTNGNNNCHVFYNSRTCIISVV